MSLENAIENNTAAIIGLTFKLDRIRNIQEIGLASTSQDNSPQNDNPENENTVEQYPAPYETSTPSTPAKRKRRTKAEIMADEAKTEGAPIVDIYAGKEVKDDFLAELDTPQPVEYTIDMLKAEASALVNQDTSEANRGLIAAQTIMQERGFKMISAVPENRRAELVQAFRKAVKDWK